MFTQDCNTTFSHRQHWRPPDASHTPLRILLAPSSTRQDISSRGVTLLRCLSLAIHVAVIDATPTLC